MFYDIEQMPILEQSSYKPPFLFKNSHLLTIYTALFREKAKINYSIERISTPDKDFIDLDWIKENKPRLAILCHGLEGSSDGAYVINAASFLNQNGFDICAMNYRGCSGETNNLAKSYHSGKTEDLELVINHVINNYQELYLVGFSVGGNLCLKYLGERGSSIDSRIKAAATFSVPVSLESCAIELAKPENYIYMKNFLLKLEQKILIKEKIFPQEVSSKSFHEIKSFIDYDERYTAPLNGFKNAQDYWTRASSQSHLENIRVPSLLVSALDDPFLGEACYPITAAKNNPQLFLELTQYGGHLAFNSDKQGWQERRILDFFTQAF